MRFLNAACVLGALLACSLCLVAAHTSSDPLPGAASTTFDVRAEDGLLIRVGIVEEILRQTVPARFNDTTPWKFSSIVVPDPLYYTDLKALIDLPGPRLAIATVVAQWSATLANPSGQTLSAVQLDKFLSDVYTQAAVGGPGLNTISGVLFDTAKNSTQYGYVASLSQFAPSFGQYAAKTAYVLGYAIVPLQVKGSATTA